MFNYQPLGSLSRGGNFPSFVVSSDIEDWGDSFAKSIKYLQSPQILQGEKNYFLNTLYDNVIRVHNILSRSKFELPLQIRRKFEQVADSFTSSFSTDEKAGNNIQDLDQEEEEDLDQEGSKDICDFCTSNAVKNNGLETLPLFKDYAKKYSLEIMFHPDHKDFYFLCPKCKEIVKEIVHIKNNHPIVENSFSFKLLSRDSVIYINRIRSRKEVKPLFLRQIEPLPKSKNELFFEEEDRKLNTKKYEREVLWQSSRNNSPWYTRHGLDYVDCKIELPKLVTLLEKQPCQKEGCECPAVVDRKRIRKQGVVLLIPIVCLLGHRVIYHCSNMTENRKYLLNELEYFSTSSSMVRLPHVGMKNVLSGSPSPSMSHSRKKTTKFFKDFGKIGPKEREKIRSRVVSSHMNTLVDARFARIFWKGLKTLIEKRVDVERVEEVNVIPARAGTKVISVFEFYRSFGIWKLIGCDENVSPLIFLYMYGCFLYKNVDADARYATPGFKSMECTGIMTEMTFGITLFEYSQSKARNKTPDDKIFTKPEDVDFHKVFAGPSSQLEEICFRGILSEAVTWRKYYSCCGRLIGIGIMPASFVTDRDGKIFSVYMEIVGPAIACGLVTHIAIFHSCFGHGKKSLHTLINKVAGRRYVDMALKDLDFTFKVWKSTDQYKELKRNDPEYENKCLSLLGDIFQNCLDHHAGVCCCTLFGINCPKKTKTPINITSPVGIELHRRLSVCYHEFKKIFPVIWKQLTTSLAENRNSVIAAFVPKNQDFSETYRERVMFALLRFELQTNFFLNLLRVNSLPISPSTLYYLEMMDRYCERRVKRKKVYVEKRKYENRSNLKLIHKKREGEETFYSSSSKEKDERLVDFDDIDMIEKQKGMLKRNMPKENRVKSIDKYMELIEIRKTQKKGYIPCLMYICLYCEKNDVCFRKVEYSEMIKHMKRSHKRANAQNYKKNLKRKLISRKLKL